MEKTLGLILISVYAVWFFMGQNTNVSDNEQSYQEVQIMEDRGEEIQLTQTQIHKTIKMTAEKEGWMTTEFKNNTLIAEKIKEDDAISVTITFSKLSFSISPENDNLQKAISKALKI